MLEGACRPEDIRTVLRGEKERVQPIVVHPVSIASFDVNAINGKLNGIGEARRIDRDSVSAYENAIVRVLASPAECRRAFFVMQCREAEAIAGQMFKLHNGVYSPDRTKVIYSPDGHLLQYFEKNEPAFENLIRRLSDGTLEVLFLIGTFLNGHKFSGRRVGGCLGAAIADIQTILKKIGRNDVLISINKTMAKEWTDFTAREGRFST